MSYNPQNPNGQATSANSSPVVIANDQSAVPVSATSLPLPTGAATGANQTNGGQKTQIVDGSGNVIASTANALNVNIASGTVSGSENITQLGGNNLVTAGVNGTLATGGNQAAGSNVSTNTNPLLVGGSDYGGTPKLQTLKVDSSGIAQIAVTNSPTVTANVGTTNGLALDATLTGGNAKVQGSVASGSADSGNPVKVGGVFNTSAPTLTTGQRGDLQVDASGNLKVNIASGGASSGTQYAEGATAATATGTLAMGKSGTTLKATQTDASGNLRVDLSQTSANATAIKVDGSGVTQPVSGTVTANIGTTNGLALNSAVTGLQVAQGSTTSGQNGNLSQGAVTTAAPTYTTAQTSPLSLDTSGNLRTSVNNTVTVSGTVTSTPSGTQAVNVSQVNGSSVATAATGIAKVGMTDGTGNAITSTSSALDVNIKSGGSSGATATDEAAWTAGSSSFAPTGAVFNDTAAALTSGQQGTLRATNNRGLHTNLRNSAGTEVATSSNPLRIDPTGTTTQPVSGTVTANIGTTNGVALDSSVNGILLSQGSTTSGQKGGLSQGAVTTAAPTYTTAQTSPLSLDTSGNLRTSVNNTVTVSGTVTSTPSGTQSVNTAQIAGSTVATAATGIQKVGLTDGSGTAITSTSAALDVNIKSGGTSSAATTDEAAWTAGTSNFAPTGGVFNDSAAALTSGQQGTTRLTNNRGLHTNLRNSAGTEIGTSSTPIQVSLANTATNATAVKVDGSAVTQPVSGSVTANIGTTNGLALNSSVTGLQVAQGSTTSGQNGDLIQGAVTTAAPSYTTAQTSPLSLDTSGNLRTSVNNTVTVSGTVTTTPPSNASTNIAQVGGSSVALGQTTMAGSIPVAIASNQGAFSDNITQFGGSNVVTGTGASGSGIPRVTVANDSNVLTTQSGTWTVQPGNTANTTPWLTSLQPATSGGWSVSSQTGLTNSIIAIKGSAGQFGGYMFNNPNSSTTYIQIFNSTTGGSTLGSPTYVIPIPPNASANVEFANGIAHATAISAAATTAATGTLAPTTALTGFFIYK